MADIKASMVKELRDRTGLGMMEALAFVFARRQTLNKG